MQNAKCKLQNGRKKDFALEILIGKECVKSETDESYSSFFNLHFAFCNVLKAAMACPLPVDSPTG